MELPVYYSIWSVACVHHLNWLGCRRDIWGTQFEYLQELQLVNQSTNITVINAQLRFLAWFLELPNEWCVRTPNCWPLLTNEINSVDKQVLAIHFTLETKAKKSLLLLFGLVFVILQPPIPPPLRCSATLNNYRVFVNPIPADDDEA